MTIRYIDGGYVVENVNDLDVSIVTNIYNTGSPYDSFTLNHAGPQTIYIPQASIFQSTFLGQTITPGSFQGVQSLLGSSAAGLGLETNRSYTLDQIINLGVIEGGGNWNMSLEHGANGFDHARYVDHAYILGTQNFVLDRYTTVVNIDSFGRISLGNYQIRLDIPEGHTMPFDDFDFVGGGIGARIFNSLFADSIDAGGQTVGLIYTGEGKTGISYSAADLANESFGSLRLNQFTDPTSPYSLNGLRVIVNTLADRGIINSNTDPILVYAAEHWMKENLDNNPDFLSDEANFSAVLDLLGPAATYGIIHELTGQCFPAGTLITMANGTQRRIEDIRLGDTVLSFDPATGAHLPRKVTKLYRGETDVWIGLTYTQNGIKKSLSTTSEHPFLTPDGQFAPISQVTLADERRAA